MLVVLFVSISFLVYYHDSALSRRPVLVTVAIAAAPVLILVMLSFLLRWTTGNSQLMSSFYAAESPTTPVRAAVFFALYIVANWIGARMRAPRTPLRIATSILLIIAITTATLLDQAQIRGQKAAEGEVVQPLHLLGLVILDVSSPKFLAIWSDPKKPYPSYFGTRPLPQPAEGTLIGQTGTSIVLALNVGGDYRIVRFDARQVIVEFV